MKNNGKKTNLMAYKNKQLIKQMEIEQNDMLTSYLLRFNVSDYNALPAEQRVYILDKLVAFDARFDNLDAKIGRTMVELELLMQKPFSEQDFLPVYSNLLFNANRSGFYSNSFAIALNEARQVLIDEQNQNNVVNTKIKTYVEKVCER